MIFLKRSPSYIGWLNWITTMTSRGTFTSRFLGSVYLTYPIHGFGRVHHTTGVVVAVGGTFVGVAVGASVAVGGAFVAVSVAVGGIFVAVGGTLVAVGGTLVAVSVAVGENLVAV